MILGIVFILGFSTTLNQALANPCNAVFVKQAPNELVIKVRPNGVDDTENIQCALDWAVDTGMSVMGLTLQRAGL